MEDFEVTFKREMCFINIPVSNTFLIKLYYIKHNVKVA